MGTSEQIVLTQQQERFADAHGATSCANPCEDSAVCVYRVRTDKTIRWIVAPSGRVLERTEFDRL